MARQAEVEVGQVWTARVSGRHVKVRVDSIHKPDNDRLGSKRKTTYGLTNLTTGRTLGGRSAAFLRTRVEQPVAVVKQPAVKRDHPLPSDEPPPADGANTGDANTGKQWYRCSVSWTMVGGCDVQASSLEEARQIIEDRGLDAFNGDYCGTHSSSMS